ncbi:MAG: hypothetical protein HRF43_01885, partial [Phycisphaerae bacterium]
MVALNEPRLGINPETMLPDLFRAHPQTRAVFDRYGLVGCGGRMGPAESVRFFARSHGVDEARLLAEIQAAIDDPASAASGEPAAPHASVADSIYRRFFLAGIAAILTAGATWG